MLNAVEKQDKAGERVTFGNKTCCNDKPNLSILTVQGYKHSEHNKQDYYKSLGHVTFSDNQVC